MLLNFQMVISKTEYEIIPHFVNQIYSQDKRYRSRENGEEIKLKSNKKIRDFRISKFLFFFVKSKSNEESQNIKKMNYFVQNCFHKLKNGEVNLKKRINKRFYLKCIVAL